MSQDLDHTLFPAPSRQTVGEVFPHIPALFASRVMGPIGPEPLSGRDTVSDNPDTGNKLKLWVTTEEDSMSKRRIAPLHPGFYLKELLEEPSP